jgi:serine/threonine protein kinase
LPTFGRYQIESKLGEGAMGVVWRARDTVLDRVVALKVLAGEIRTDQELDRRFRREAEAVGLLSHPRIVAVYDVGEVDGQLYMAMELVEGEDLREVIARRGQVPLVDRVRLMVQICEGVAYAHSRGVVHRDLKPANMIVTPDGRVKLLDFGLARLTSRETITRVGVIVGTPDYMSPEQASGRQVNHRSDIFSVGSVFYELLTFQKPFLGQTLHAVLFSIIASEAQAILSLNPDVPARLAAVVHGLLRKSPDQRPEDLADVAQALRRVHAALRRSNSRSALPAAQGSSLAPLTDEMRTLFREHLARGQTASGAVAVDALRKALVIDPDCDEAAEMLWSRLRETWAEGAVAPDPTLDARVLKLLDRARGAVREADAQQALAELVLLVPDDPRVTALFRGRSGN